MSEKLTKEQMNDVLKVETKGDLFTYMKYNPNVLVPLIEHISRGKWQCRSSKYKQKKNRITVHAHDGEIQKPLYFDCELNIYESGKKARTEVQEVMDDRIMEFINKHFTKEEVKEDD